MTYDPNDPRIPEDLQVLTVWLAAAILIVIAVVCFLIASLPS